MTLNFRQLLPHTWGAKASGLQFVIGLSKQDGTDIYDATWTHEGDEMDIRYVDGGPWETKAEAAAACDKAKVIALQPDKE